MQLSFRVPQEGAEGCANTCLNICTHFCFNLNSLLHIFASAMCLCVCVVSDVSAVVHLKSFGAVCLAKGAHFGV